LEPSKRSGAAVIAKNWRIAFVWNVLCQIKRYLDWVEENRFITNPVNAPAIATDKFLRDRFGDPCDESTVMTSAPAIIALIMPEANTL